MQHSPQPFQTSTHPFIPTPKNQQRWYRHLSIPLSPHTANPWPPQPETFGSGTTSGVGFGNKTNSSGDDPNYDNSSLRTGTTHDASAYSGSTDYGSGTTGGAGFGNKTGSFSGGGGDTANDHSLRTGTSHHTQPYSGHTDYGSGSTGGAGFGNKTGSFSSGGEEGKGDSTIGKILEKTGTVLHSGKIEHKGHAKREAAGAGSSHDSTAAANNNTDNDDISKVTTASSDALGRREDSGFGRDSTDSDDTEDVPPYSAGAREENAYGKTDADKDRLVDETAAPPTMSGGLGR